MTYHRNSEDYFDAQAVKAEEYDFPAKHSYKKPSDQSSIVPMHPLTNEIVTRLQEDQKRVNREQNLFSIQRESL